MRPQQFKRPSDRLVFAPSQPSTNTVSQTPPPIGPDAAEAKPSAAAAPSPERGEAGGELGELRGQMKQLLASVELLKVQQT